MGEKKSLSGAVLAKRSRGHEDDAHEHKKQKKSHHHKAAAAAAAAEYDEDDDDDDDDNDDGAFPNKFSSTRAKKRVRNIERRLRGGPGSLPATVQQDLERELAALRAQLAAREAHKHRAHMIKKYHMLRFFERKKATRLEKQLERRLAEAEAAAQAEAGADDDKDKKKKKKKEKKNMSKDDSDKVKALRAELHIAHIDRLYTQYFPFLEPYVSLYPASSSGGGPAKKTGESKRDESASDGEANGHSKDNGNGNDHDNDDRTPASSAARALHAPRPPMWSVVEETLRTGGMAALEALRERRPGQPAAVATASAAVAASGKKLKTKQKTGKKAKGGDGSDKPPKRPHAPVPAEQDDDDDSDGGGFFEAA